MAKLIRAVKPKMPKLLVALYGPAGAGKTLLVNQLPGPSLVFDADGRYMEQSKPDAEIYFAFETPAEMMDIRNITTALNETLPTPEASNIANVIIDTMTMPFQQLMEDVEAMPKSGPGSREAKTHKAKVMKGLRRALFSYNKNVVMIYHTHMRGDGNGGAITEGKTMSDTELARLNMCINMTLRVEIEPGTGRRGVKVEYNRFGHQGFTVWDDTGRWVGFWEKLQAEAYKNLTWEDMHQIAAATPTTFADKPAAWAWGMEQGVFKDVAHARNAMDKMDRENEIDPDEYWSAWVANVMDRKASVTATTFASGDQAMDWGLAQGVFATLEESKAAYQALKTEKKPSSAKEAFTLWINHVQSLMDDPATVAQLAEPETTTEESTIEEPATIEPVTDDLVMDVPFSDWVTGRITDTARAYAATVQAASNGAIVSPAQVANLRHMINQAAGWNEESATVEGFAKADWIANVLAGRTADTLTDFPAGAAKLLYTHIYPGTEEKKNKSYDDGVVALVKEVGQLVDQYVYID